MIGQRLLFAASEVFPFAKSGGLADVAYSLPHALADRYDVHVIMPLYQCVDQKTYGIKPLGVSFDIVLGDKSYPVEMYGCEHEGITYRFIYSGVLCDRESLYGTAEHAYDDNAIRFGLFSAAIVAYAKVQQYDILHLNDWQTALAALWAHEDDALQTKTLFTIHNLSYQGIFDRSVLYQLGIDERHFNMDGLEFYGQVNFMKAGIAYADRITTVSPSYAKEILTPQFGCGLEGFLKHHRHKLRGIVNGIDTVHFSPSEDKALVAPYTNLQGKAVNKRAYLKEASLKDARKPLFVFVGRFAAQKGLDLLIDVLPKMASSGCNIAILGEGEERYHEALKQLTMKYDNLLVTFGYDEALSHRMYAAADFFLMPSHFEPCGLAQMIAMHYGSIPVVHHVGGLRDTVHKLKDYDPGSKYGFGIAFMRPTARALMNAIGQALALYAEKRNYNRVARHNMACDFSWHESAKSYDALYQSMIED